MASSSCKSPAQLAGFTLIELLAVLVIISSTSWLLIRAFDPSSHSTYQFLSVFNQYVMQAQSYALADQSQDASVTLVVDGSSGAPNLTLKQRDRILSHYQHGTEMDIALSFADSSSKQHTFAFSRQAMLQDSGTAGNSPELPTTMLVAGSARYCFSANGFLKAFPKGC